MGSIGCTQIATFRQGGEARSIFPCYLQLTLTINRKPIVVNYRLSIYNNISYYLVKNDRSSFSAVAECRYLATTYGTH